MPRVWVLAGVVFLSFLMLAAAARSSGLATAWVDPVARIGAQDEAIYAVSSLEMARHGGWLTPMFLGRYALYKPPLLYWLSALSVKVVGESPFALRLPSLLAGAGTVGIVFVWVVGEASLAAALTAALLVLSSHLFFVLSGVAITDSLLTFETTVAVWTLARDPQLESRSSLWAFGLSTGAAILTKAVAGTIPFLVLIAVSLVYPLADARGSLLRRGRSPWRRLLQALAIAGAVALPWHLWQLWVHPHWLWGEYVMNEHFAWGVSAPQQTTGESGIWFYPRRLALLDPVLCAAAVFAFVKIWRGRGMPRPYVVLAWLAVLAGSILAFQYRNASYLMPGIPATAVLAGLSISSRRAGLILTAALAIFGVKAFAPTQTWGLPFGPESTNPSHAYLNAYIQLARQRELIIIEPDDQFYSATLRLPKVRYVYLDPRTERPRLPLDYEYLGTVMAARDYLRLLEVLPEYQQRLHAVDLDSTEALASVILAKDEGELVALLRSRPEADFYAPEGVAGLDQGTHNPQSTAGGRVFLFARP